MNEIEMEIEKFTKLSYRSVCESISDEWVNMGGGRHIQGGQAWGIEELDLLIEGRQKPYFRYSVYLSDPTEPDFNAWDNGISLDLDRDIGAPKHLFQFKTDTHLWLNLIDFYNIGVRDILNIQPHEYGVLKLRYRVDKDDIFIPKIFHGIVRALYKELGLA